MTQDLAESQNTTILPTDTIDASEGVSNSDEMATSSEYLTSTTRLDIEHALVEDDPRVWSDTRKTMILFIISGASMIAGLCNSIQNPANSQIQRELHATDSEISWTLSLFILIQGNFPILWSAVSEIKGRKLIYSLSLMLFTVGSAIVAVSNSIELVIGMRVVQGAGSSAAIAIGAATLADIYEPHQRGSMMGVYYSAPLLGPAIGPILGGGLTQAFKWRAVFWFLVVLGGIIWLSFLFLFKDTFRKERSLAYQGVLKRRILEDKKKERNASQGQHISKTIMAEGRTGGTPALGIDAAVEPNVIERQLTETATTEGGTSRISTLGSDIEAQPVLVSEPTIKEIKLSIADVNPIPPYLRILSRKNNVLILLPSGFLFAFSYSIMYTCARTLSLYYGYDAMTTGLVLLTYGIGSMLGSILGGRWSDKTLARLKVANGGVSYPEMRLESTKPTMWLFPPSVIGYAWVCQQHLNIAAVCVMLFLTGFCSIWIYASTLAYIVDANVGRSSSAVATNSSFRGLSAFIAVEIAIPLQDVIGDGGLYSLWAGLMFLAELMILLVLYKGKQWRDASIDVERRNAGL